MKRVSATCVLLILVAAWFGLDALSLSGAAQAPGQANGAPTLNLFYIGKRRSTMEPCGCHTKQQGGVQHEAILYEQQSAVPSIRVDSGEWAAMNLNQMPVEAMKTRYLMQAMAMFPLDAVNIGFPEMQLTAEYYKTYAEQHPKAIPNFVSANIFKKDKPQEHAFPTERIVTRQLADGSKVTIGITGVTPFKSTDLPRPGDPDTRALKQVETASFVAKPPEEALKPVLAALRPKVDLLILLDSGDFASGVELAKAFPQVDYIIANTSFAEPKTMSYVEGNVKILCVQNYLGKELGLSTLERGADKKWLPKGQPQSLAVGKSLPSKDSFVALINAFKKETQKLDVVLPAENVKAIYAGDVRCLQCHEKEHTDWSGTRHAHAMQSLVDKGQQFNPECLKCHTTGFRKSNGFYSITHGQSQMMMNVQCEMCHGPAQEHTEIQQKIAARADRWMAPADYKAMVKRGKEVIPQKKVAEATCLECHTPENDNNFVYSVKLKKIDHTQPSVAQGAK